MPLAAFPMQAPFPWFGGKRRVAAEVWDRFGPVKNYVEPFFGSGAVLLGRPTTPGIETVNDLDGYVANFFRALRANPDAVARAADRPVNENDLHALHSWLTNLRGEFTRKLEGDAAFYSARVAGIWAWGVSCWIGSGFASDSGPWHIVDSRLIRAKDNAGQGVHRKLPHLSSAGQGVCSGRRKKLIEWFGALSKRLERVHVCCGDWKRVTGPCVTFKHGLTGVFLDPPYGESRDDDIYSCDSTTIYRDVRDWCLEHGKNHELRIALCGYSGETKNLPGWSCYAWKANGGYANKGHGKTRGKANAHRERIWFSPHCLKP